MEGRQTKAASVYRRTACWRIRCILSILFIIGMLGILITRNKPEADSARGKNEDGKVLRFDVLYPIGSLDPKPDEGGDASLVFRFFYSYLFIMNENGQLKPDLATEWVYDKETFTWTIQIREGARFHDGSPVTTSDVVYSLNVGLDMVFPSAWQLVNRITAINEKVFVICLKKDDPGFLEKTWSFEILKQPIGSDTNNRPYPVGSGPFKFDYRIGNSELGLTANEHYYRGRPAIDRVVFYHQPDKERSWTRLLAGQTDLVRGVEVQDYQTIEHYVDEFYFKKTTEHNIILLVYNTNDPNLSDPKVRMALSLAIDKQHMVRVLLKGMGVVPSGLGYSFSPDLSGIAPTPYDPSKSVQLLREAGWTYDSKGHYLQKDGKPFELTILFFEENSLHESIARFIQLWFNDLGLKVRIQPLPFNDLIQKFSRNADFQAVITEFLDTPTSSNVVLDRLFNVNQAAGGSFSSPRITAIADQLSRETDRSRRKALLDEMNSMLHSLQPATFLVQKISLDILSRRFILPSEFSSMYYQFDLWQVSPASR